MAPLPLHILKRVMQCQPGLYDRNLIKPPDDTSTAMISLRTFNAMNTTEASDMLEQCCAAQRWVKRMVDSRPFADVETVLDQADQVWSGMTETDYLQAFDAHPKIGDPDSLKEKYRNTHSMAAGEQSGMIAATDQIIADLSQLNADYYRRFGFIFIVCASGKSAEEMLSLVRDRVMNSRSDELITAAEEQRKITALRLENLLTDKDV